MGINIPLLTVAALTNGLNPCGIGMMITFLGYLIVFGGRSKEKNYILKIGLVYIFAVFLTYLLTGLLFYGVAYYFQHWWLARVFKYFIGGALMVAGIIQLKDAFCSETPIHLQMSSWGFEKLTNLMSKASVGVAALIGFLTTIFSTPCMLPLYIGTTAVIARSGLPMAKVLGFFLYYNLIFILPLIIILMIMAGGKQIVMMKEWQHKNTKWMRLILGIALVATGFWIAIK